MFRIMLRAFIAAVTPLQSTVISAAAATPTAAVATLAAAIVSTATIYKCFAVRWMPFSSLFVCCAAAAIGNKANACAR